MDGETAEAIRDVFASGENECETTVTGIGVEWGSLTFKDRFFEVVGGNKRYQIASLTSSSRIASALESIAEAIRESK